MERSPYLIGLALWKCEGENGPFISVTVPSREGEDRWYEFLHGDLSTLRRAVRRAYTTWLERQPGMKEAKAFLAEVAKRAQDEAGPSEQPAGAEATPF